MTINFDDWGDHHGDDHPKVEPIKKEPRKPMKNHGDHHGDDHPKTLHLEDLLILEDEFWEKMITRRGALKNFLTRNKPLSKVCLRSPVLAEIIQITNEILAAKLQTRK